MASMVLGTKVAKEYPFRIDVQRTPCQVYRMSKVRTRNMQRDKGVHSIFCRLCHLEKKAEIPQKQKNKLTPFELNVPGTCKTSNSDPLRCRCDKNSLDVLRQVHNESPAKNTGRTLPSRFTQDRFMNEVLSNFLINETAQMPLSTLIIRWKLGRTIPSYDKEDLLGLLSCYGDVYTVYKQSPNSAIIIFRDITSACRVMQAKHLGEPRNKIHCVWYHKFMNNKAFYSTSQGLKVRSDPFIQMHNNSILKRYA
ncbi:hypothetical protein LOTGIDRAFT_157443 [Lottia gigantea]|uniref:RRM domain-containing protein n=1 Tax=Lottia gigantea TaxID=225164 RepID=V4AVA5_LOTGI|nr:hypothetical protein LOTGIDRAFT_157443 [Lottia gigantea]ESP01268.1 hypothetical protein LOTGIDRAFT_157443 [Lottia gigantea]